MNDTLRRIYKSADGGRVIQERYLELLSRWPVRNQHLRVPTREGETFIVACGPESAPPLLLFQGSGANAAMWLRDVAAWAAHFRVYAVDMIGEPGLSAPSRPPLASEAYALWLDDVMHALSLTRASIVGVSLGGWLALDYATRRPARVEAVVVLSPSGVGKEKDEFSHQGHPLAHARPMGTTQSDENGCRSGTCQRRASRSRNCELRLPHLQALQTPHWQKASVR
jgi:pimeloyl-ACP methyl ester carboxylesterase